MLTFWLYDLELAIGPLSTDLRKMGRTRLEAAEGSSWGCAGPYKDPPNSSLDDNKALKKSHPEPLKKALIT